MTTSTVTAVPDIQLLCMEESFSRAFQDASQTLGLPLSVSVSIHECALSQLPSAVQYDTIVSPANSYGRLDGAFDDAISRALSPRDDYLALTRVAQKQLYDTWRGFAPPGTCTLVSIPDGFRSRSRNVWGVRRVALCPTMRMPGDVNWDREVVYECVWSLLCAVDNHNRRVRTGRSEDGETAIRSILMTPLATGVGRVAPQKWAEQLVLAVKHFVEASENPGMIATLRQQQVQYYHELHQTHGPFVRVSPTQVFTSDLEAFKTIHKMGSHFRKADYYHYFGPTEAGKPPYGLFQMTDIAAHGQRRRLLGRGFTLSFLRGEWEAMVKEKVQLAVDAMGREAEFSGGVVDVRKWWVLMAGDVVSRVMFGQSFDTLKTGEMDPWFEHIKYATLGSVAALFFPVLHAVAKRLPIVGNARVFHAHKSLIGKGRDAVANSMRTTGPQSANLFAKVLSQAEKSDGSLTEAEICTEAASFMIAGTDTTSNTLTYLLWAVLQNPTLQKTLEEEVTGLKETYTDVDLETLPVLHAVIEETLRLYGAAPAPLPRVVPDGGIRLGDYHFPAGTEVSTQAWTLHRDSRNFSNPEEFDHTRWLPGGEVATSANAKAAFSPFGSGARVCIGKHLAYMELRYAAAMFFRKFPGCHLSPETTPESMEMNNIFLIEPKGVVS
ncbi:Cytochrome P450 monooxygenase cypX [Colletotrichum spinosum]|uniref:Cytochrome P450 monooxygenase cypX n=1 Tax=Colletotrichum spinosum TaxID=1347390 RepID=A0A4R8QD55_9PEZI|nr:Cytochrome P450 monooxygenase cypX [Colletotrichum spinosum]